MAKTVRRTGSYNRSRPKTTKKPSLVFGSFNFKSPLALSVVALFIAVGGVLIYHSYADVSPYDVAGQAALTDDPARGIAYTGLQKIKEGAHHPCAGLFEIKGSKRIDGKPDCTHGPDPAPVGVDLTNLNQAKLAAHEADVAAQTPVTTAELLANPTGSGLASRNPVAVGEHIPFSPTVPPCNGNGTDSYRVHFIYAYTGANRLASLRPYFNNVVYKINSAVEYSSVRSGSGSNFRALRVHMLTDSRGRCTSWPDISQVKVSLSDTGDGNSVFGEVKSAVSSQWKSPDRDYVIWLDDYDVAPGTLCGISNFYRDERPKPSDNTTNRVPGYALITHGCWDNAELHETFHALGAVGYGAPATSGGAHCWILNDVMCYADGGDHVHAVNGHGLVTAGSCGDWLHKWMFDCHHDNYFDTRTHALRGSYLAQHYDIADSPYLSH